MSDVLVSAEDPGIAVIVLNRPHVLNALTYELLSQLRKVMLEVDADPEVRVVIITGAGEKAFCAGADVEEMSGLSEVETFEYIAAGQRVFATLETLSKPVIAAVNGYALGGGCELAVACDLRIAASTAFFGQPEVNLGHIPGWGGTQRLARLIGLGHAKKMVFTGDLVPAQEALQIGLVEAVVEPEQLMPHVQELAGRLTHKPPVALRMAKECLAATWRSGLETGLLAEALTVGLCASTDERKQRIRAFLAKRSKVRPASEKDNRIS